MPGALRGRRGEATLLGLSHERCGGGSSSSPCRAKPRGGPGRRHPPRWRGGGGGDGRAPLPRTPAAASWPGREPGRREHVGRRLRASGAGSERVCPRPTPAGTGRWQRPGGTPPGGRRGRPLAQPCQAWAPSRAAGARGGERGQMAAGKGMGRVGQTKGKAEPPLPWDSPLRGAGIQPLRPELGAPGGAAAGRGWERRETDGRGKGEKGREGGRKEGRN